MKLIIFCAVAFSATIFAAPFSGDGDRIVGGDETTIETHPYIFSLRLFGNHWCGGSILNPYAGLTAAHCLDNSTDPADYEIIAGSTARDGDENGQIRTVSDIVIQKGGIKDGVIAIVYWNEPLTYGPGVRPIKLPEQDAPVPYGQLCNVTGWGQTSEDSSLSDVLRSVSQPLVSNEECNRPDSHNGDIDEYELCAGWPEGDRDACDGDEGGPLVVDNVLFGVSYWGLGCARPNFPGVYARVPFFADWIRNHIE